MGKHIAVMGSSYSGPRPLTFKNGTCEILKWIKYDPFKNFTCPVLKCQWPGITFRKRKLSI